MNQRRWLSISPYRAQKLYHSHMRWSGYFFLTYKVCLFLLLCCVLLCVGCVTKPPTNVNNVCSIFRQYPAWQQDAMAVQKRWGVPISVQMAIIHQESRFKGDALPERRKILWVIPWTRPSSAYGYTQALDSTWASYKDTEGGLWATRDDFSDAVNFVGWYVNIAHRRAGIPKNNAYALYLAYHEGVTGYQNKTYLSKNWLLRVARKVQTRATIYKTQLASCKVPDYP